MVDVARLGLAVDSSQVDQGSIALDRLSNASQRAEAAARGVSIGMTNASSASAQAASRHGFFAGIIDRVSGAFRRGIEAARSWAASLRNSAGAVDDAAASLGNARMSTANVAAQFQDIAVSAQMGMTPLMIGLQQGTQLAAVISMMENPVKGLGAAFLSIISPVSLIVIGFTALIAAGLQMVDWAIVARGALNGLADILVTIVPYAATAAAGLALLYAPAIIGGLGKAVGALGSVAQAIFGIATAIYAAVGLPALLVAGFVALVAAAVIWRDDLAKMLGFDIVKAGQDGVNAVIGLFVGAFNAIKAVWGLIPAAFADIFTMAMNGAVDIVQNGVNGIIGALRTIPGLGGIEFADLSGFKGQMSGAAAQAGQLISQELSAAQGQDYVGGLINTVQTFASDAAGKLRDLAAGINLTGEESKKAAKEAERQAEAYAEIVRSAEQRIAAANLEASTLGMTREAAERLRIEQELLNKAANDNIELTPRQVAELNGLAAASAAAEESTRRLTEAADNNRSIWRAAEDGVSSVIKAWIRGKSVLDAVGNKLLDIADMLIDMAVRKLFLNALGGGGLGVIGSPGGLFGGAILPGILHGGGIAGIDGYDHRRALPASVWNSAPRYHGGTSFAGLRPDEVPAILQRGERVIPAGGARGGHEVIEIVLKDDSGRMADIADRRIRTASGAIVQVSVERSFRAVRENQAELIAEASLRNGG